MYESATNRLTYWFWFSLLLSLAPLAYSVWELLTQQAYADLRLATEAALKHGELILICVPLLGGTIGEIIKNRPSPMIGKVTIGGITVLLFFFAASTFVSIATSAASGNAKDAEDVLYTSLTIFVGTIMVGAAAIIANRQERSLLRGFYD